ncbi:hypothetical protein F511_24026 [Dorcoceras hygrometricum]|uniref:Zinc finger PHD-type domain-containing protein n=1 Tax=Dorcoceras hygrometricum TaxID=472368 RepID=A0A2Z7AWA6_9LAMI|nr:hypothetical protein F511_24026 [Dorcoceras hygrometricum]
MEFKHFSHTHSLVFHQVQHGSQVQCSGCKTAGTGNVYACWQCSYFLHEHCYRATRSLRNSTHPVHPLTLMPYPTYPSNTFICNSCHIPGNGFSYGCAECDFDLHIHCANNSNSTSQPGVATSNPIYPPIQTPYSNYNPPHNPGFSQPQGANTYPPIQSNPFPIYPNPNPTVPNNGSPNYPPQNPMYPPALSSPLPGYPQPNPPPVQDSPLPGYPQPSPPQTSFNQPSPPPPALPIYTPPLTTITATPPPQPPQQTYTPPVSSSPPPPPPPAPQPTANATPSKQSSLIKHFSHPHILQPMELEKKKAKVCSACECELSGSAYCCTEANCTFNLHKACFDSPVEVRHKCHLDHPLTLLTAPPYKDGFTCNACLKDGKAFAYHCATCSYDLHIDCITWPETVTRQDHKHPLSLYYSSPAGGNSNQEVVFMCDVCKNPVHEMAWVYYCRECDYGTHLECVASGMQPNLTVGGQTDEELLRETELKFAVLQLLLNGGLTVVPGK